MDKKNNNIKLYFTYSFYKIQRYLHKIFIQNKLQRYNDLLCDLKFTDEFYKLEKFLKYRFIGRNDLTFEKFKNYEYIFVDLSIIYENKDYFNLVDLEIEEILK